MIHVKDASRAVGVVQNLRERGPQGGLRRPDRRRLRARSARSTRAAARRPRLTTLERARANGTKIDWDGYTPPKPNVLGVQHVRRLRPGGDTALHRLDALLPLLATEGRAIRRYFDDPEKGAEARKLFADAQDLLDRIVAEKWLTARAVFGLFPANALEDDSIEVYTGRVARGGAGHPRLPAPAEAEAAGPSEPLAWRTS